MSEATAARLGRWSFYAGWTLGVILASLAVRFDWPDWTGAAIAFGVPFAAHGAMDRIVSRLADAPPEPTP